MKKILLLLLFLAGCVAAQVSAPQILYVISDPTGNACGATNIALLTTNGQIYTCQSGVYAVAFAGSGITSVHIAGTANEIAVTGTCTITTTGTCTLSIPSGFVLPGTINGLTITSSTGTFTLTNAKTFTVNNTVTIQATDSSTIVFPAPSGVTDGNCVEIHKSGTTLTFADAGSGCGAVPSFTTLTDGATVTWAVASAPFDNKSLTFTTHGGSRTLNITGLVNGGSYVLKLIQDGTGGEGLILGTGCTWKVSGGGSGAITPSTGVGAIDVLAFTYDGTNCYANFAKNFN